MASSIRLTFRGSILLVVLAILGLMAAAPTRQAFDQHKQIEREQVRLEALRAENLMLEKRVDRLNDPEYIEKLARQELGLVRQGEISYVIVPGPTETATAEADAVHPRPWYGRIFDWFKERLT